MTEPPTAPTIADVLRDRSLADALPPAALAALYGDVAALEAHLRALLLNRAAAASVVPAAARETAEFLSVQALAQRIPYDAQTIRNLMSTGTLKLGVHYFKPAGGRPMFSWPAVRAWVEGRP